MKVKYTNYSEHELPMDKPFLVLGKGPTLERAKQLDLSQYTVIGLNHVGYFYDCNYVNVIDIEVLYSFPSKRQKFIVPWHPHIEFKVGRWPITKYKLTDLKPETEFIWYNCSTWKREHQEPLEPYIRTLYFSSESVFQLLIWSGVKTIYSCGIDGGTQYHNLFTEIGLKPLENGQSTFSRGVHRLKEICRKRKVEWIPLI